VKTGIHTVGSSTASWSVIQWSVGSASVSLFYILNLHLQWAVYLVTEQFADNPACSTSVVNYTTCSPKDLQTSQLAEMSDGRFGEHSNRSKFFKIHYRHVNQSANYQVQELSSQQVDQSVSRLTVSWFVSKLSSEHLFC